MLVLDEGAVREHQVCRGHPSHPKQQLSPFSLVPGSPQYRGESLGGGGRRSVKGVLAALRWRICVAGSDAEPLMGQAKSASQHISPRFKWEDFK